jgi:protease I
VTSQPPAGDVTSNEPALSSPVSDKSAAGSLNGTKVAILVCDGFEQVELVQPREALDGAGARTFIVSPQSGSVHAWNMRDWGDHFPVDVPLGGLEMTRPSDYDALLLPGGVMNPDQLRTNAQAVQFVKGFFQFAKPVASICHGLWTLVEADVLTGRTLTSWPSLRTDIANAGGTWVNKEVVRDGLLVTARMPADLAAFNEQMIALFAEVRHGGR